MSHNNSSKAVFYAFVSNLGIAITKTIAAVWTGSGSLLAESIHSYADCGNQVLLFVGMKRSTKKPTKRHPLGYGRESYIWSMMVAIVLFSVGGMFSVYEGIERIHEVHAVENAQVALIILVLAIIMESLSLKGALSAMKEERGNRSLWRWFKETHSSELMLVACEDIAALLGLVIAAAMLGMTMLTGNPLYDAIGSVLIGALLVTVSVFVGIEVHSLLLGESDIVLSHQVEKFLRTNDVVINVFNVMAINQGNDVVLAVKVELLPTLLVEQAVEFTNAMEVKIKNDHPRVKWVFFELDNKD